MGVKAIYFFHNLSKNRGAYNVIPIFVTKYKLCERKSWLSDSFLYQSLVTQHNDFEIIFQMIERVSGIVLGIVNEE